MQTTTPFRVIDFAQDRALFELQRQRRQAAGGADLLVLHGLGGTGLEPLIDQALGSENALCLSGAVGPDAQPIDRALEAAIDRFGIREIRVLLHPATLPPADGPRSGGGDAFARMRGRMLASQERTVQLRREGAVARDRLLAKDCVASAHRTGRLTIRVWVWVEASGVFSELDPATGALKRPLPALENRAALQNRTALQNREPRVPTSATRA